MLLIPFYLTKTIKIFLYYIIYNNKGIKKEWDVLDSNQ